MPTAEAVMQATQNLWSFEPDTESRILDYSSGWFGEGGGSRNRHVPTGFSSAIRSEAELHVFGYGERGLGLGVGDPDLKEWPRLLLRWLRPCGFLTDGTRTAVSGHVTLDGKPTGMVWMTFVPDDERSPIARVRIHRDTEGAFEIPAAVGPVPGPHRVEVQHVIEQIPHAKTGTYSLEDSAKG